MEEKGDRAERIPVLLTLVDRPRGAPLLGHRDAQNEPQTPPCGKIPRNRTSAGGRVTPAFCLRGDGCRTATTEAASWEP